MSSGKNNQNRESLGLIAGGGRFPLIAADAAREKGLHVIAVAHLGETDPALSDKVDEIVWIKLGQLGRLIKTFKKKGVGKILLAGTITKKKMFENIRPDLKGLAVMSRLAIFHDDDILRAVAKELADEGIETVSSAFYLPDLVAPPGCLTRRKPGRAEREDIRFGWKVAKELGRLDIGQCVVVRKKTVLALEAIEGTDETILRGGSLGREKAVVVKVSKPQQDLRFDVPAVGVETVRTMALVKASALAVEAGKTLIFDKSEMIQYADRLGVSIVALEDEHELQSTKQSS
ncbi:MAG: UDP-2,3-diacylglucosamine diphosphatase LpxI [Deltaproteobacteria bacterium]|nr:UDP-2,3-diacylglucosamine diphosphatase LpxI [Deltaproteobacteria bacterium]